MSDVKCRRKMRYATNLPMRRRCSDTLLLANQEQPAPIIIDDDSSSDTDSECANKAKPICAEPKLLLICWHIDRCPWNRRRRCLFEHEETPRDEIPHWTQEVEELRSASPQRQEVEELSNDIRKLAGTHIPCLQTPDCQTIREEEFKDKRVQQDK